MLSSIQDIEKYSLVVRLEKNAIAGSNTVHLRTTPGALVGATLTFEPGTVREETRLVSAVSEHQVTLNANLSYSHNLETPAVRNDIGGGSAGSTVYNVREYGAIGDGVADDTAAFEAIRDALIAAHTGGAVYIPIGTYKCTRPIVWPYQYGAIKIYGDGARSRIYYSPADGTHCWTIPQWMKHPSIELGAEEVFMRFIIRDLSIFGAGGNNTGTGAAIRIYNTLSVTLDSLVIRHFGGTYGGIYNQGGQNVGLYRCFLNENGHGIRLEDCYPGTEFGDYYQLNSNNVGIRDCHIQHNTSHGVYISIPSGGTRAIQTVIDNCIIQGNGKSAVYAEDFNFLTIKNCYFETNANLVPGSADIHTEFGYWLTVENCESHWGGGAYTSMDINGTSHGWLRDNSFGKVYLRNTSGYLLSVQTGMGTDWDDQSNYSGYIHAPIEVAFSADDATPSVIFANHYTTANANPTTITDLDDGLPNDTIYIKVADANTTFDFSGTNLKGNDGADYVASAGDVVIAHHWGTSWYCTIIQG